MKSFNSNQNRNLKIALVITVLGLLTACGNSKSNNTPTADQSSNRLDLNSLKLMANCNKAKDTNFSLNTSIVTDQTGKVSNEFIKMKFNFISADITKSGNVIKFFKWRVVSGQAVLDPTALEVAAYDLSSGQTVGNTTTSLPADQMSSQAGYYVQLNDPNAFSQVVKVVAYDSTGKVIGNLNSLIPSFNASPEDYKTNSDGTPRADVLQQLHLLYGTSVAGMSASQIQKNFDQYCF